MTTFAILLGGPVSVNPRLLTQLEGVRTIAADSGIRHAGALGLLPELWVGDFDSSTEELAVEYAEVPRLEYPSEKSLTDGELAVQTALERGATRAVLVGALGGERADHAWAHLVQAMALSAAGIEVLLTSGDEEGYPFWPGSMLLDLPKASLFSVLGLDALDGLTIRNARYPLDDFHLPFGSSRTISNVAEGAVSFSLRAGRALVLARPHDFSGV
ncbi:thiamine diphosphokinase [Rhizobium sp. TH2]|uniref:thiamine diphosphokinase n=1 Tax=Rhizobium sp. TH2 TaxID=2775403 RepID=UPI00215808EF|nr:thiamine diphosphokinase [Rhizobium sp. TH2]UVC08218.1 thiamine diphosphokinase [Rhizobium sp. TH2]